jgi:hypothetical protein
VIDRVCRLYHASRETQVLAGVGVAIETGKVAAGNLQSQLVSCEKNIARSPKVNRELVDFSGI